MWWRRRYHNAITIWIDPALSSDSNRIVWELAIVLQRPRPHLKVTRFRCIPPPVDKTVRLRERPVSSAMSPIVMTATHHSTHAALYQVWLKDVDCVAYLSYHQQYLLSSLTHSASQLFTRTLPAQQCRRSFLEALSHSRLLLPFPFFSIVFKCSKRF